MRSKAWQKTRFRSHFVKNRAIGAQSVAKDTVWASIHTILGPGEVYTWQKTGIDLVRAQNRDIFLDFHDLLISFEHFWVQMSSKRGNRRAIEFIWTQKCSKMSKNREKREKMTIFSKFWKITNNTVIRSGSDRF